MMDDNSVRDDIIPWTAVKNRFLHSHLWVVIVYVVVLLLQIGDCLNAPEEGAESQRHEKDTASKAPSVHVASLAPSSVQRLSSVSSASEGKDVQGDSINYDVLKRVHGDFGKVMRLYIQGLSKGGNALELESAGMAIMSSLKEVKQYSFIPRDYVESVENLFAFMTTMHRQRRVLSRYGNTYEREAREKEIMVDLLQRMERFNNVRDKYGLPEWK